MLQVLFQRLRSPTALQSLRCFASDTGALHTQLGSTYHTYNVKDSFDKMPEKFRRPWCLKLACGVLLCEVLAGSGSKSVVRKESKAQGQVAHQKYNEDSRTITVTPGQAFPGDNRSSSGLGLGDGLTSHTAKWLQVGFCSPNTCKELKMHAA